MSSHVLVLDSMEPAKRRHYSKKGCKECKRRKIKCDEGKPSCWQCHRLKKPCEYPVRGEKIREFTTNSFQVKKPDWSQRGQISLRTAKAAIPNLDDPSNASSTTSPADITNQSVKTHETRSRSIEVPSPESDSSARSQRSASRRNARGAISSSSITSLLNDTAPIDPRQNLNTSGEHQEAPGKLLQSHSQSPAPTAPTSSHAKDFVASTSVSDVPTPLQYEFSNENMAKHGQDGNPSSVNYQPPQQTQTQLPPMSNISSLSPLPDLEFGGFSKEDLDLLANDLNNIVNNIMVESNFEIQSDKGSGDFDLGSSSTDLSTFNLADEAQLRDVASNSGYHRSYHTTTPALFPPTTEQQHLSPFPAQTGTIAPTPLIPPITIPQSVPLDFIKTTKSHEKLYLAEFYNEFAGIILPFNAYDETKAVYTNPARDIILTCAARETYLLAAILAQGAKSCFKKSGIQEDERAYCHYLSKCLQLLGPALNRSNDSAPSNGGKNQNDGKNWTGSADITANIESVLLTVLLLTSANASNTKQNWRAHLRGAKDLLLKYSVNNEGGKMNQIHRKISSSTLIFCKFWYISIEVLAGLSSEFGGTLKRHDELDLLITPGDEYEVQVMRAFKLINDEGFNILFGYHNDCVVELRDLVKVLNTVREKSTIKKSVAQIVPSFELFRLITSFYNQSLREFIDISGKVSQDKLQHVKPGGSLIETFTKSSRYRLSISWVDISHQSYIIASLITILTKGLNLPSSAPHVQELVSKFTSMLEFLNYPDPPSIKYAVLMIQWSVSVIGQHCLKEDERFLVMKFFRLSAQNGSGSAAISLRRLHKQWTNQPHSKDESDELEVDVMTY